MTSVTVRELRKHARAVLDRVQAGEVLIVTRDGTPVAELRTLLQQFVPARELLARWAALPKVDAEWFRRDIDSVLDPSL